VLRKTPRHPGRFAVTISYMNISRGLPRAQSRGFISPGLILLLVIGLAAIGGVGWWATRPGPATHADFGPPERVTIEGYTGLTEDPYITSDGKYLLFDNAGSQNVPITLFYAKKIDYKTFTYVGKIQGLGDNGPLQGGPAIDTAGNLYFLSEKSYAQDFASIWHGTFTDGVVTNLAAVVDISKKQSGWMNMGAIPTRDGKYLYFTDNGPRTGTSKDLPTGVSTIVVAKKNTDGTFTRVANSDELMKNVNTVRGISDFSYGGGLSNDNLEIFFVAPAGLPGHEKPNDSVYVARRTSITEPFGVAKPLNTGPGSEGLAEGSSISSDGKHFYYHKVVGSGTSAVRTTLYVLSRE